MAFQKNSRRILVIDDDEKILRLLRKILDNSGFETVGAVDAEEAFLKLAEVDVIIADCMLPGKSGIDFIREIRKDGNETPAILLTAIDTIDNKIFSFKSGVDDYLTKPFDERELIARIERMIERQRPNSLVRFGECVFNEETGELFKNGGRVFLSSTESCLLVALLQNPNQPVSRNSLATTLGVVVSERTVDVQITRLRKKIGDNAKTPTIIQTVRHIGYALIMNT